MTYRVEGPFLREGLPHQPLFLIVVGGCDRKVGQGQKKRIRRPPAFFVVSAVREGGNGCCPGRRRSWEWAWQRWELEVEHREVKSRLGPGEKRCWTPRSAVASVQWSAWVYGVFLLAGYRTWGGMPGASQSGAVVAGEPLVVPEHPVAQIAGGLVGGGRISGGLARDQCQLGGKGGEIALLWNTVAGTARI